MAYLCLLWRRSYRRCGNAAGLPAGGVFFRGPAMDRLFLIGPVAFALTAMTAACIAGDPEFPYGVLSVLIAIACYYGIRQRARS